MSLEFKLTRRKYGHKTYTWAYVLYNGAWVSLGDPWPCITPKKSELHTAALAITRGLK